MFEKDAPVIIKPTSDIFIVSFLSAPKNEPSLRSIINAALQDKGGRKLIETARVLNPFNIKKHIFDKRIALDVRVEDNRKRAFNIEIQTYPHPAFCERILYGWANSYSSQLVVGENYKNLKAVITIVITEFAICRQLGKIHSVFELRECEHPDFVFSDHIQLHVWQLDKLIKGHTEVLEDVTPDFAHWSNFFVFGNKISEAEMTALTDNDPRIIEAYRELQQFTADPQIQELARQRHLFLVDYHLAMNAFKKEGKKEGRKEGRKEGKKEGRKEGIKKGKKEGQAEGIRNTILVILRKRFTNVPQEIETAIQQMNDPIALELLSSHALDCQTLDDFVTVALK
ncbi:MAG: Rpn family recombination-promoting nuclease/putative transposase [Planctomycetaceae bacterium]|jgi:predicted transposase/invertase (TIGR01784 family)|nr:Rpn family recombination-promoting nuclease/putative transposase [Planctomycetaceae bacterium]